MQCQRWVTKKKLFHFYTNIDKFNHYKKKKKSWNFTFIAFDFILEKRQIDTNGFLDSFYSN